MILSAELNLQLGQVIWGLPANSLAGYLGALTDIYFLGLPDSLLHNQGLKDDLCWTQVFQVVSFMIKSTEALRNPKICLETLPQSHGWWKWSCGKSPVVPSPRGANRKIVRVLIEPFSVFQKMLDVARAFRLKNSNNKETIRKKSVLESFKPGSTIIISSVKF